MKKKKDTETTSKIKDLERLNTLLRNSVLEMKTTVCSIVDKIDRATEPERNNDERFTT
jgi:hypothetical protein